MSASADAGEPLLRVSEVAHMFDIGESTVRRGWSGRLSLVDAAGGVMVGGLSVQRERARRIGLLNAVGRLPGDLPTASSGVGAQAGPSALAAPEGSGDSGHIEIERLRHVISTLLVSEQSHLDAIRELTAPATPNN